MIARSDFRPAPWLRNPHLQTIWASLLRRRPPLDTRPERLELPDGDFVDLLWCGPQHGPIIVVLHGLEGSIRSRYAAGIMAGIAAHGWRGVFMHFRGCSGVPNRLPRSYHSGDTGDIRYLVETLRRREPQTPLAAVGYSLGGNALLKYLGESGRDTPLEAAVAVSVPFDLDNAARRLERGLSRLYQRHLLASMHRKLRSKFAGRPGPVKPDEISALRSFRLFDDKVTAPLHGFAGVDDYYARCSSRRYLTGIGIHTLILHASDDPFMTPQAVPGEQEMSPTTRLELSRHGGHVGFVSGRWPWRTRYWLEERILAFLTPFLG